MSQISTVLRDTDGPWGDMPKATDRTFNENIELERQAAVAAVNERAERRKNFETHLSQLTKVADEAKQRLTNATDRHQHAVNRVQELKAMLLQLAGQSRAVVNVDPYQASLDAHLTIVSLEASIKDWPRVQAHLSRQVAEAQAAVTEFSKHSPK